MSKLLREYVSLQYNKELIREAVEKKQPVIVNALLQRADAVNQNKRIYPRDILQREVENYTKAVNEGRACGELDHPESSVVNLQNVSHVVREIFWNGNDVMGKVEILTDLPNGKIALGLLSSGIKVGISSRGVGETVKNESGFDVVDESFMLVAFDLVSEPSTQEAWLMREGKEVPYRMVQRALPRIDRINRIVNDILRK